MFLNRPGESYRAGAQPVRKREAEKISKPNTPRIKYTADSEVHDLRRSDWALGEVGVPNVTHATAT